MRVNFDENKETNWTMKNMIKTKIDEEHKMSIIPDITNETSLFSKTCDVKVFTYIIQGRSY